MGVEDGFAYIQMELCDASLKQLVQDPAVQWDEKKYRTLLKQVATGIKHLHDKNLCHMDIKPENIFVKDGVFKIGDMGLVTVIKGAPREIDEGDCRYLPREVLQNDEDLDLRKADVFSLGCSMYAVITRRELPRNGSLWHEIRNGRLRYLPKGQKLVSPIFAAIIKHMMSPNAADRPTIDELLAYKFLGSDIEKRIRRQDGKINELQKRIRQLQGRKLAWSSNAMAKRPTLRRTTTL